MSYFKLVHCTHELKTMILKLKLNASLHFIVPGSGSAEIGIEIATSKKTVVINR